jgi:hypothetical protein
MNVAGGRAGGTPCRNPGGYFQGVEIGEWYM